MNSFDYTVKTGQVGADFCYANQFTEQKNRQEVILAISF